ncbi:NAD(+)/NADH kinase [Vibrio sp. D431a]|uniref:NAD(+)/NADH kinase n=1 Tax=Vibrio sp. D431a TaxID=2837388 RepID=UPI002555EF12|nr:NAD(+)/NADH kinase [Vibrio sp. D431a]MDK9790655.1 NAD(+)/NADH kinase [Vibrio sp. D431a]
MIEKFYLPLDRFNSERCSWIYEAVKRHFTIVDSPEESDAFLAIGGDGTLLSTVRDPSRGNKPILALNGGTVGANLIDVTPENIDEVLEEIAKNQYDIELFPRFELTATDINGVEKSFYVFNDAWADRLDAACVRYRAKMTSFNHTQDLSDDDMSGDGILFSTATGSTGYARMHCDIICPHGSNIVLCVPMCTMINKRKTPATIIEEETEYSVEFIDTHFRKTRLAVDGVYIKDEEGNYFVPQHIAVKICKSIKQYVKLITSNKESFKNKQYNFIGR